MAEDIDALAAVGYASGRDPIELAVERVALMIELRDRVLKGREEDPQSFPVFGPTDQNVVARRVLAQLLDAGWHPPSDEEVVAAANRSRESSARYRLWLDNLSQEERTRALEHFSQKGCFPPDLQPPT